MDVFERVAFDNRAGVGEGLAGSSRAAATAAESRCSLLRFGNIFFPFNCKKARDFNLNRLFATLEFAMYNIAE